MEISLEIKESKSPVLSSLSIPVSEEMKSAIQEIKKTKDKNGRLFNDLTRQFFAQLIEKYKTGKLTPDADGSFKINFSDSELGNLLK